MLRVRVLGDLALEEDGQALAPPASRRARALLGWRPRLPLDESVEMTVRWYRAATGQKVANMDELNTIIVVTHDITAAAAVADHLWLMGRDHDAKGNPLPGSHIVATYDLVERDLCWHPQIITQPKFMEFVREVKDRFRSL